MQPIEFLAVGDIVTEPFIRLKDASVHCKINNEDCEICMRWGDKIPYEFAEVVPAVGNSSNAAVAAARLGLRSALMTDIGDDDIGRGDVARLEQEHVVTDYVRVHAGMKSNYHYVLWYENERTILVKHEEYPYQLPADLPPPPWLYLSSLADHSLPYHQQIAAYVQAHPEVKFVFQPGTFQMKLGVEMLKDLYASTFLFFCNKEEAERILALPAGQDFPTLLKGLAALGPRNVVVTDGTNGAYAFDGSRTMKVPMYPDARGPYERTGAGDAFASTVTAALVLGKPLEEALLWGPINAMCVVQEVGAQKGLLSREALLKYLADAPAEYKITDI